MVRYFFEFKKASVKKCLFYQKCQGTFPDWRGESLMHNVYEY